MILEGNLILQGNMIWEGNHCLEGDQIKLLQGIPTLDGDD